MLVAGTERWDKKVRIYCFFLVQCVRPPAIEWKNIVGIEPQSGNARGTTSSKKGKITPQNVSHSKTEAQQEKEHLESEEEEEEEEEEDDAPKVPKDHGKRRESTLAKFDASPDSPKKQPRPKAKAGAT